MKLHKEQKNNRRKTNKEQKKQKMSVFPQNITWPFSQWVHLWGLGHGHGVHSGTIL
jgi:hypothetical protein